MPELIFKPKASLFFAVLFVVGCLALDGWTTAWCREITDIYPSGGMDSAVRFNSVPDRSIEYNRALKRNPKDYVALWRRGKSKEEDLDYRAALGDFTKSLQYNPLKSEHYSSDTNPTQRTIRAWTHQEIGYIYCLQGKYQQGVDALSRAIALRPNYADNYQNRAAAYKALGKSALARQDVARAKYLRQENLLDECLTAPVSLLSEKYRQ